MPINGIIESKLRFLEQTLAAKCLPPADTAAQNVKRLQELGILKDADRYAEMVRFRNFIVHRYEQIDPEIIYGLAKNKLGRFREFVDEIRRACAGEKRGPSD